MDKELARMVVASALRARIELGHLVPFLKQCDNDEKADTVSQAIATAVYEIGMVADKVFEQYPELSLEVDARRNKYGRPF